MKKFLFISFIFFYATNIVKSEISKAYFAGGCFWCMEESFEKLSGVEKVISGYSGGTTDNPTYEEVCSGNTNHAEVVKVAYDLKIINTFDLLVHFWEGHNPTQGMRQGNDVGTQYRSGIYCFSEEQFSDAEESMLIYQSALSQEGFGEITTEIVMAPIFYFAEDYHQQYLGKNPNGYCGLGGTGLSCAI